jgi:predicted nucleic acid-binding protein
VKAFVDADILICHLRGENKAYRFLRGLLADPSVELWTGSMQRAEVLFFMRPAEEEQTMLLLSQIKTAPADQSVIDEAGRLYRKWNPSRGVDANDAILAATVLLNGGILYTQNKKHYPMKEVAVQKAW